MSKEIVKFVDITNVDIVDKAANKRVHLLSKRKKKPIVKDAKTFKEIEEEQEAKRNLWDDVWTLESSLESIIEDSELSLKEKATKVGQTIKEFAETIIIKRDTQHEETEMGKENNTITGFIKSTVANAIDELKKGKTPDETQQEPDENQQNLYKSMVEFMGEVEDIAANADDVDVEATFNKKASNLFKSLQESKVLKAQTPETEDTTTTDNSEISSELKKRDDKIEQLEKNQKELQQQLKKKQYLTKAEDLENLSQPDELSDLMLEADEKLSKKNKEIFNTLLKSANAQLKKSNLFTELGSNSEGDAGSPEAQWESEAQALLKSDSSVKNIEEARTLALEKNADLKAQVYENQ